MAGLTDMDCAKEGRSGRHATTSALAVKVQNDWFVQKFVRLAPIGRNEAHM